MSHLEELLPEFRKGAKIRQKHWEDGQYIFVHANGSIHLATGRLFRFDTDRLLSDDWELYQEPIDWEYVIKNKCLCWFWDEHDEEMKKAGILAYYDNNSFKRYIGDTCAAHWYERCSPVRRDEVTFYEDKKDE